MAENEKPKASYKLPEYEAMVPLWDQIQDCEDGETAIKSKTIGYLPMPNVTDQSDVNKARYAAYVLRAVFYNFTARTLKGFVGMVYQKDPQTEITPALAILETDVDGSGVSLLQQSQKTLASVVSKGRAALLVDFPVTEKNLTKQDLIDGQIHPTIIRLKPEQIINWRTKVVGSKTVLSLVTITEKAVESDNGFEESLVDQWRVLKLVDGVYLIELWQVDASSGEEVVIDTINPRDGNGNPLNFIPLTFVGSVNNDPAIDQPPLYDLSVLNIAHFRNSADYEEACFILGQPTPWISGLDQAWVDENFKEGIQLGARTAVLLPDGSEMGLLQVEPNTMPKEAMEAKERQAVALGAKLVEQKTVQRTATESASDNASDSSVLGAAANNVSEAYGVALKYASIFLGKEEESTVQLNTDFDSLTMSPQETAQLVALWTAGGITDEEFRAKLKDSGLAYEDLETWQTFKDEHAETQMMLLGMGEENSDDEEEDDDNDDDK